MQDKERNIVVILLHLVLLGLYTAVFLSVDVPALTDYPNHLARMFIVTHYNELPLLQKYYYVKTEIAPYLGIDAFFYTFSFLDIYTVGKLFLATSFALITLGVLLTNYALFKKLRYESLLCYPFFLNANILFGLVNFYFCIGFVMIGFAIWLMLPERRKYIFLFFYAIFLFFIHLFGMVILMLLVGLYLFTNKQLNFKVIFKLVATCIIPLFILLVLTTPHELAVKKNFEYPNLATWKGLRAPILSMSGFSSPAIGIFTGLFFFLLAACRIVRFQRLGLMLILLCIICTFMPITVDGIYGTQIRIPLFIGLLFASSAYIVKPRCGKYFIVPVYVLLTIVTLVFSYGYIQIFSANVDEYRAAVRQLPKGSKILPMANYKVSNITDSVPCLAIIESNMFVPDVFTGIPPLKVKPEYKRISIPIGLYMGQKMLWLKPESHENIVATAERLNMNESAFYFLNWRKDFDYVVIQAPDMNYLPPELELIKQGKMFAIFKVRKDI